MRRATDLAATAAVTAPIDDVRATAAYRRRLARGIPVRGLGTRLEVPLPG